MVGTWDQVGTHIQQTNLHLHPHVKLGLPKHHDVHSQPIWNLKDGHNRKSQIWA